MLSQSKPATASSYYCSEGCDLPQNGNDGREYTNWSPDRNDTNNPWWRKLLAATVDSGVTEGITIWRVSDGRMVQQLVVDAQPQSVTFSPNGQWLAAGFQDDRGGRVQLWRTSNFRLERTWYLSDWVFAVAFSPDSTYLAAGGDSSSNASFLPLPNFLRKRPTIRVWRVDGGWAFGPVQKLSSPQESVLYLTFTADGKQIISTGGDRAVVFPFQPVRVLWRLIVSLGSAMTIAWLAWIWLHRRAANPRDALPTPREF